MDVIMPQMGESIAEGTIVKWLKKPGDTVEKDEPLFEIVEGEGDAAKITPVFTVPEILSAVVEIGKRGVWTDEQMASERPDVTYEIFDQNKAEAEKLRDHLKAKDQTLYHYEQEIERQRAKELQIRGWPIQEPPLSTSHGPPARPPAKSN